MSSLNLYRYNSKKNDTTYENVGFFFNLEQIPRKFKKGLGHLEMKESTPKTNKIGNSTWFYYSYYLEKHLWGACL